MMDKGREVGSVRGWRRGDQEETVGSQRCQGFQGAQGEGDVALSEVLCPLWRGRVSSAELEALGPEVPSAQGKFCPFLQRN